MQSKGIFSLELLLGETQQKHISTLKKLAQIKNEMTFLGLEFTGRTGLLRGQIEIPNDFADRLERLRNKSVASTPIKLLKHSNIDNSDAGNFIAALANGARYGRKDAADLGVATTFWHNNTQYNTNTNHQHLVFDTESSFKLQPR